MKKANGIEAENEELQEFLSIYWISTERSLSVVRPTLDVTPTVWDF